MNSASLSTHSLPTLVDVPHWSLPPVPDAPVASDEFLRAVGAAARSMPAELHDSLVEFADRPCRSGAIVLRGLPVGSLPHTPASPTALTNKDNVSEFVLLSAARRLGQPVGYLPEHGGDQFRFQSYV